MIDKKTWMIGLFGLLPLAAQDIGGVYEVGIGTTDAISQIGYWQQFGFTVGKQGTLDAKAAKALYGVSSKLRAIRLRHQDADHGLIRIMIWEKPSNAGLGIVSMKTVGNRWTAMLTGDATRIMNHVEEAKAKGFELRVEAPQWATIYASQDGGNPFQDKLLGVREMMLLRPESRQILFQRFNYNLPLYGKMNEHAFFPTSQVTHVGLVVQDDSKKTLDFYKNALGLLFIREGESTFETAKASRLIFDLKPGESYSSTDFDDPRSSADSLMAMRSGRLKIIRFPDRLDLPNRQEASRPGALGLSLYTYRVKNLAKFHKSVQNHGATEVTEMLPNEFGETSFSFIAPDGYFWTLVGS